MIPGRYTAEGESVGGGGDGRAKFIISCPPLSTAHAVK